VWLASSVHGVHRVSKVVLNAYSSMLATRQPPLQVNCVHPGCIMNDVTLHSGLLTPEDGANNVVKVALLPEGG
jgi:(+)-neomenthol dehydrogenase